jgi:hypothetical protein
MGYISDSTCRHLICRGRSCLKLSQGWQRGSGAVDQLGCCRLTADFCDSSEIVRDQLIQKETKSRIGSADIGKATEAIRFETAWPAADQLQD